MKDTGTTSLNKFAFSAGGSVNLGTDDSVLMVESDIDQLSVMSDFNITRDAVGLDLARDLVDILLGAIQTMKEDQQAGRLPTILAAKKPVVWNNPLA